MQPIDHVRSNKILHKLSVFGNLNHTIPPTTHQTKHNTLKTIKSLKPLHDNNIKQLSYLSSTKNIIQSHKKIHNDNLFEMSTKDIQKLYQLMDLQNKTQQQYDQIDNIFCRYHLGFFQETRLFLNNLQYHQLINKCRLLRFAQNRILSKKGKQDLQYFVLLDGVVSFNQQKVTKNIMKEQEQIQYNMLYTAQNGMLLNSQALNSPKYNPYTMITHSTITVIAFNSHQTYSKLLKKFFIKQSDQQSSSLSNTSLFRGISTLNIKKLLPYFFNKNFYKFNQSIYKQGDKAQYVYWVLDGEVQLIKEQIVEDKSTNSLLNNTALLNNIDKKKYYKIVKLSKNQIFGIDDYPFKPNPNYQFTAKVTSQSLKTICISYKSLIYIQNEYPCLNENIDFYLKRSAAMHAKILQKNHRLLEVKDNNIKGQKKKNKKRNKKNKKKNPQQMQWWGLAQNNVGSKKYKLQLPKFVTLQHSNSTQTLSQHSKTQPMFDSSNYRSTKIQQFRKKLFQQDIDEMIQAQQRKKSINQNNQSPYKVNYVPKINKLRIKVLDIKPKTIDETQKVKKKLLSYAKNLDTFCDKLNLD